MNVKKIELSVSVEEKDLIRYLFSQYNTQIEEANIIPESSIIRNFTVDNMGKCTFRICSVTLTEPEVVIQHKVVDSPVCHNQPLQIKIKKPKKA